MRHNRVIQSNHLRKHWQRRIKTHFDQPGKKVRRRRLRAEKAAKISPRPVEGLLRPVVQCPTLKYNMKCRKGRGFTLKELELAGINKLIAPTIGIAVDHRRINKSKEILDRNVERLKAYMSKLILFPKKAGVVKPGDATADQISKAKQLKTSILPMKSTTSVTIGRISDYKSSKGVYKQLIDLQKSMRAKPTVEDTNDI